MKDDLSKYEAAAKVVREQMLSTPDPWEKAPNSVHERWMKAIAAARPLMPAEPEQSFTQEHLECVREVLNVQSRLQWNGWKPTIDAVIASLSSKKKTPAERVRIDTDEDGYVFYTVDDRMVPEKDVVAALVAQLEKEAKGE